MAIRYYGRPVKWKTVWAHVRKTDCTCDSDFLDILRESIKGHPRWSRATVDLADLDFVVSDDVEDYAGALDTLPIVIVPEVPFRGTWSVLDGAHRASLARHRGQKSLVAYAPVI